MYQLYKSLIRTITCLWLFLSVGQVFAASNPGSDLPAVKAVAYDSVIIDLGNLQHFVANNTKDFSTNEDPKTFRIGRDDLLYPSMNWREGGYGINNYLSSGLFILGNDSGTILFDSGTSTDFTVRRNQPGWSAPQVVSYSMTDDSAGIHKKGLRTVCRVYGWTESWRDDFLIYEYVVQNQGLVKLYNLYAGLLLDFDISSAGQSAA